jgi:hypothetical protein
MKVICQYGVLGDLSTDGAFSILSPNWHENFSSYPLFLKKYGLIPLCCVYDHESLKGKELIIVLENKKSGDISSTLKKEKELEDLVWAIPNKTSSVFRVLFDYGAMRYHLCALAKIYTEIAVNSFETLKIPGYTPRLEEKDLAMKKKYFPRWIVNLPTEKVGVVLTNSRSSEAVFFEMMAFLTSARSILDSFMPIIQVRFGKKNLLPDNYHDFMTKVSKYDVPPLLKDFVVQNGCWVTKLINYRNCVVHAKFPFPSTFDEPSSMMVFHSDRDIIAIQTLLPDNPADKPKKSNKEYTFDEHIEYLSYAHQTYVRMLNFLIYLLKYT